jgi:hypothetical protein
MAHRYAIRKVERGSMDEPPISRAEYVRKVLEAYCHTPGTTGTVRRPDRLLAAQLHQRGVPLTTVENALILAAARRLLRSTPPLAMVRSLAYFLPVIEEVLQLKIKDNYFQYIRRRLQRFNSAHT